MGTDGAANLCGCRHSLYTLLKKDDPDLILIKCMCHSLHLACSNASEELPSNLDYMLRQTFNWFHRSAIRRQSYMDLFKLINDGKEPLQLVPLSGTRWLARSASVTRLLAQWNSLKVHFQQVSEKCDKYLAQELTNMYNDVHNELYFTFLQPILHEFERLNMLYQKDNADHSSHIFTLENFFLHLYVELFTNITLIFQSIGILPPSCYHSQKLT